MIFAGILAGGTGTRMNITNMPKQFLMLGSKPIIIHTLEKFLLSSKLDYVYVGVHNDWITYCKELIDQYIKYGKEKVRVVEGGNDRNGTIMNIVSDIEKEFGESDNNIIVTHDAVRPFVTLKIIEKNIDAAIEYGACDTVIPASDTIVESKDCCNISEIPNRKYLYQGQTPQSFRIGLIKKLYQELSDEEKNILTDACKICVIKEQKVHLVEGDTLNIKITTINDYNIAKAILSEEEK